MENFEEMKEKVNISEWKDIDVFIRALKVCKIEINTGGIGVCEKKWKIWL